jgi:Tol biopolymer transport system component
MSSNDGFLSPAWSPDGSETALMMRREGNPEIFIMSRNGAHPKRLTKSWSREVSSTWSPRMDR